MKNKLLKSLMFLLLGGCASGLFSHGDNDSIADAEAKKKHNAAAIQGFMRDERERIDAVKKERTDKMMFEQAKKAEENKQAAATMMAKIKANRMQKMKSYNKGKSLQELTAAFMIQEEVLTSDKEKTLEDLSEVVRDDVRQRIDYVISRYDLEIHRIDDIKNRGTKYFVEALDNSLPTDAAEILFEEHVKQESLKFLENLNDPGGFGSFDMLKIMKGDGFKPGTARIVKKITLAFHGGSNLRIELGDAEVLFSNIF